MTNQEKHDIALEIAKICINANINEYLLSSDHNSQNIG